MGHNVDILIAKDISRSYATARSFSLPLDKLAMKISAAVNRWHAGGARLGSRRRPSHTCQSVTLHSKYRWY
jgi:hypothetical protein